MVIDIAANAHAFNLRDHGSTISKIEYTFDNRPEIQFSATRLYGSYVNEPGWTAAPLLAPKLLFDDRTNPRIQMADMIAREGMKDLDRLVGPVKFLRRSKAALAKDNRFHFFTLRREDFERDRLRELDLEKDGISEAAYHSWLGKTGAQDTWDNRARFIERFDAGLL